MSNSILVSMQAAPAAAEKKANGATAAAAVPAVEEEAIPSHDVYGHLPKPEENDKVCPLSYHGTCTRGQEGGPRGGGEHIQHMGKGGRRGWGCGGERWLNTRSIRHSAVNTHASQLK